MSVPEILALPDMLLTSRASNLEQLHRCFQLFLLIKVFEGKTQDPKVGDDLMSECAGNC